MENVDKLVETSIRLHELKIINAMYERGYLPSQVRDMELMFKQIKEFGHAE